MKALSIVIAVATLGASPALGQQLKVRELSRPEAVGEHGFTHVASIKELRDGRVIVLDSRERIVQILDATLSTPVQIGRNGSGPHEYLQPDRILSLRGDTVAIDDPANRRMLVVTPDGRIAGARRRDGATSDQDSQNPVSLIPNGTDARGYFYAQARPTVVSRSGTAIRLADSAAIVRWMASTARSDTVAFVPIRPEESRVTAGPGQLTISSPRPPFWSRPQWAVSVDGRTAVVHMNPYRVDIIHPNGTRNMGPVIATDRIRVTETHKAQWRAERSSPRTVTRITRGSGSPVVGRSAERVAEPSSWPEYLPPFLANAVHWSADNRVWVERTTRTVGRALFDVFDATGRRVEQVLLPPRTRLVGFGSRGTYLVRRDELDLEYLERYR